MDYQHQGGSGGSSGMIILAVVVLIFLLLSSGAGAYYYYYYYSANNAVTVDVTNVAAAASVASSGSGTRVCGGSKMTIMDLTEYSNLDSNLVSMYCSNLSNFNVMSGASSVRIPNLKDYTQMISRIPPCPPGQQPFTGAMTTLNVVPGTYTGTGTPPSISDMTMFGTCVSNGSTITHTSTFQPYSRR
jgi:hypothetical protein